MTDSGWHWAVSNAGPETLLVWLEPWAEEFEVPPRSTLALRFNSEADDTEIECTADHIVVWAGPGQTARVYIDHELQESASASIPVPGGFDGSTKELLGLMFGGQPSARLGGEERRRRIPRWGRLLIAGLAALIVYGLYRLAIGLGFAWSISW
jgi:hypothetical protein